MFKIGDLISIHKPFTNLYKIFDIKEYWIPADGETLPEKPADTTGYTFSRIFYYKRNREAENVDKNRWKKSII